MPDAAPIRPTRARRMRGAVRFALLGAVLGGAVAALVLLPARAGIAEERKVVSTRFLSVTGEGSSTKAWYDGAPPAGVPLQDALDKFSADGFRVVGVTEPHAAAGSAGAFYWSILLEGPAR